MIAVAGAAIFLIMAGCPNPLLNTIEEVIEEVVTPPVVSARFPDVDAADVPPNLEEITVSFDKPIREDSGTTNTFRIVVKGSDTTIAGTVTVNNDTVTFKLREPLQYDTTYVVIATTSIFDTDGNPLSEEVIWEFTTGRAPDTSPPVGISLSINGNAVWTTSGTVELQIVAEDNFGVAQMNISNTNSFSAADWTTFTTPVSWTLSAGQGNKTVYVKLKDAAGYESAAAISDTIQLDSILPVINQFRINYGQTATNAAIVVLDIDTTDEGSGPGEFSYRAAGAGWTNGPALTTGPDSSTGQIQNVALTVDVNGTQTFEAQVIDTAGNTSDVAVVSIVYEQTAPDITETFPINESADFPSNAGIIYASFSEQVDPNTITIDTFYLLQGSTTIKGSEVIYISEDESNVYPRFTALLTGVELNQNESYVAILDPTITDVARNALAAEYRWSFRTADALDSSPPTGTVKLDTANPDHPTETASNNVILSLRIEASDTYNVVYGIKIWGDNDPIALLPSFEQEATWELYTGTPGTPMTKSWTLSPGNGIKYLYYKLMDAASNETAVPQRLKISLDTVAPEVTGVTIEEGADYTNNPDRTVTLTVDAFDQTSGIESMRISTDGALDGVGETWEPWTPVTLIQLPPGDGLKTVLVEVIDFVQLPSTTAIPGVTDSDDITLDLTPPTASFSESDILEVNEATEQTSTIVDAVSGVATYEWTRVSGPGTIDFFPNEYIETPRISANVEGTYEIQVTLTDNAGNTSFGTVPFTWDRTPPDSAPAVTANAYNATGQPSWNWTAVNGADFYRVAFEDVPDWDFPPATYWETTQLSFTPDTALAEGPNTLYVWARDNAHNYNGPAQVQVFVDTLKPVITPDSQFFLRKLPLPIDYTAAGTDGSAVDPGASDIPATGSGISTVLWEKISGPAAISFSDSSSLNPTVSAIEPGPPGSADGDYQLKLTVTDVAGNQQTAIFDFAWDTTPPGAPSFPAGLNVNHTPSLQPTWTWETAGGGNGLFRYGWTDGSDWIEEDVAITSHQPLAPLPDIQPGGEFHILYVQERDNAYNWSDSGSYQIWVDSSFKTAPFVTLTGSTPRNTTSNINWTWTSGTADISTAYRYRINGAAWLPSAAGQADLQTATYTAPGEGSYTIEVEEFLDGAWLASDPTTGDPAFFGTSSVVVDQTAPNAPAVTGLNRTNDTTPTWSWSTGGGNGAGRFRYGWDGANWIAEDVANTAFTSSTLSEAAYTLYVQERDLAGNWSASGTKTITVDTTPPTLNRITITGVGFNPASYTKDRNVTLDIDAVTETGLQMQFSNYSSSNWSAPEAFGTTKAWTLLSQDGTRYVYAKLIDEAGNITAYKYDYIILDRAAPSVTSFSINNNANTTYSTSTTLNSSVSDANYMRIKNGSEAYSGYYTYSSARSWTLSSSYGTKLVTVQFADYAGNIATATSDAIFYGAPSLIAATKGYTSNGSITVQANSYSSETGTNTYYYYYATSETGNKFNHGNSTGTSLTATRSKGVLYYFFVRVYNSTMGTNTDYSAYTPGYSSDIVIVYKDGDTDVANRTKTALTRDYAAYSYFSFPDPLHPLPNWTVTLFPESLISSSFTSADQRYIIYGAPVIIAPNVTFYSNSNKVRNIVHRTGEIDRIGVIAMGDGGKEFLFKVQEYYGTWGYTDQKPVDITRPNGGWATAPTDRMYQWTSGNSTWTTPVSSTYFTGGTNPTHNAEIDISGVLFSTHYVIYRPSGANPPGGWNYGRDFTGGPTGQYFSVVRQGRYMFFAYNEFPDVWVRGDPYFVNLAYRMSIKYY